MRAVCDSKRNTNGHSMADSSTYVLHAQRRRAELQVALHRQRLLLQACRHHSTMHIRARRSSIQLRAAHCVAYVPVRSLIVQRGLL